MAQEVVPPAVTFQEPSAADSGEAATASRVSVRGDFMVLKQQGECGRSRRVHPLPRILRTKVRPKVKEIFQAAIQAVGV